tara:strand:+ start:284 stop:943 length:660 start_codon:yes stop_codon:yes gene_type:complete
LSNLSELSLRITEIFYSLQGEARTVGLPTVFVRLTGCPLRCVYCDTAYAFSGGQIYTIAQIFDQINAFGCRRICVTGGEPLAQPECGQLLTLLCDSGFEVSLETSGAMTLEHIDTRVSRVMDLKTPDSGESHRNLWSNIAYLTEHDQLKFVICSREDYDWARFKIDEHQLLSRVSDLLLSPSHGVVSPTELADWMLADKLEARLQLQLHKFLWNDEPGH